MFDLCASRNESGGLGRALGPIGLRTGAQSLGMTTPEMRRVNFLFFLAFVRTLMVLLNSPGRPCGRKVTFILPLLPGLTGACG